MPRPIDPSRRLARFGVFEADLASGELRKQGQLRRLQQQPFAILAALLEKPGELVTREELRQRLWPRDVTVGFDQSLNKGVTKLRSALGDSANASRYIETLQRRGYRFIAPVTFAAAPAANDVDAVVESRPLLAVPASSASVPRVAPATAGDSPSSLRSSWIALRRWWRDWTAMRPVTRTWYSLCDRIAVPARGARQEKPATSQGDPPGYQGAEPLGWLGLGAEQLTGSAGNVARHGLSHQRDTGEHGESTQGMPGGPPFVPLVRS